MFFFGPIDLHDHFDDVASSMRWKSLPGHWRSLFANLAYTNTDEDTGTGTDTGTDTTTGKDTDIDTDMDPDIDAAPRQTQTQYISGVVSAWCGDCMVWFVDDSRTRTSPFSVLFECEFLEFRFLCLGNLTCVTGRFHVCHTIFSHVSRDF